MQLDRVDEEFLQIALTPHHLIGIEGNSLKIYNKLNKQLQELSLSENKIRGIAVDNLFNTYWVYTKTLSTSLLLKTSQSWFGMIITKWENIQRH